MATEDCPVLVTTPATGILISGLPKSTSNLFQRIIRNPRAESMYARERECTEMLAAVLLNAPKVRLEIFRWLAGLVGQDGDALRQMEFDVRTEERIGEKRIDLIVEGRTNTEAGAPALLWVFEVKIAAPFTISTAVSFNEADPSEVPATNHPEVDVAEDNELVNQLNNYDSWLATQSNPPFRSIFVLALRNLTHSVNALKLTNTCHCTSWTRLGLRLKLILQAGELEQDDEFLAKHLLGFIANNLWRSSEMEDVQIDFNDIAFLRAFSKIGLECERKLNALAEGMRPLFEEVGVGNGEIGGQYKQIFKSWCSTGFERQVVAGFTKYTDPQIMAYLGCDDSDGDYMFVGVSIGATHEKLPSVLEAVNPAVDSLTKLHPEWHHGDKDDTYHFIVAKSAPLTDLLAENDQAEAIVRFGRAAMIELRDSGVLDAVCAGLGGKRLKPKR